MTYDAMGLGPLDYLPCRYGTSKLLFRGPRRDLEQPYVAFIGTTETYGKYIGTPFPALIEQEIGKPCANFGQINAGIDAFASDPFVIGAASSAQVTVVQVMGAQNMTNRFYSVHPRRNDRFVTTSTLLRAIYREVDFSEFHFNKHMLRCLMQVSPERFSTVLEELQDAWVARMRLMFKRISGKTVLLWFSDRAPDDQGIDDIRDVGSDPLFITRDMVNKVAEHCTTVVEVVASLDAQAAGTQGMIFDEMDVMAASSLLGPKAHEEAAAALLAAIEPLH